MKPFSLEEYLKNPSRRVVTRDGREVKILCTNYYLSNQCVIAEIEEIGHSFSFNQYGQQYGNTPDSPLNLFFATGKHEGWINLYSGNEENFIYGGCVYKSKELAERGINIKAFYLTTLKVEWEE